VERDYSHTKTGLLRDPIPMYGLQGGRTFEEKMSREIKKTVGVEGRVIGARTGSGNFR
jgi:hypothetical protein